MNKQDLSHAVFFLSFMLLIGIFIFGSIRVFQVDDKCYEHIINSISTHDIKVSKSEFDIAFTYLEKLGIDKAKPDSEIGYWFGNLRYYQHRLDFLTKYPDDNNYRDLLDDMRSSLYSVNSDRNSSDILHPIGINTYPYGIVFNLVLFTSILGLCLGAIALASFMPNEK